MRVAGMSVREFILYAWAMGFLSVCGSRLGSKRE